ncbi:MAG: glycosyltransferase family 4 protein [Planctomycetota bacterium]|nr:glycosyltransferase family 4 protein [Planctomycetota bacterium]
MRGHFETNQRGAGGGEFAGKRILYLAPNLLCDRRHKKVSGVDLFDFELLRELSRLGCDVTLPAEGSWRGVLEERLAGATVRFEWAPRFRLRSPLAGAFWAAVRLRGRKYDAVFYGNAARVFTGLHPLLRGCAPRGRFLMMGHRVPRVRLRRLLRDGEIRLVAVSEHIKRQCGESLRDRVSVYVGIVDAARYFPEAEDARGDDGRVRFCLLGQLDSPRKGADAVARAFRAMRPEVRGRCELHLAGYADPPTDLGEGIVAHRWKTLDEIAEMLRRMDVMVIYSKFETFSQVMVQGMLSGLPIIVNELPACVEKLDRGGGIVAGDEAARTAAMERRASEPETRRRMGEIALETARERYVWSTERFLREHMFPGAGGSAAVEVTTTVQARVGSSSD